MWIDKETVLINGAEVTLDAPPIIVADRTCVPIRFISENLGFSVRWEGDMQTVIITNGDRSILIQIGLEKAFVDGEEKALDAPAFIHNDRTMVPLRFITEAFGITPEWHGEERMVSLTI